MVVPDNYPSCISIYCILIICLFLFIIFFIKKGLELVSPIYFKLRINFEFDNFTQRVMFLNLLIIIQKYLNINR